MQHTQTATPLQLIKGAWRPQQVRRGDPITLNIDLARDLSPYSAVMALIGGTIAQDVRFRDKAKRELMKLDKVLQREASDYGFGSSSTDGSSVAFAVLRRVSRESIYTARYIDSCASLISIFLRDLAERNPVMLRGFGGVDRLSLKTLIRAVAKLPAQVRQHVTIVEEAGEVKTPESLSRQAIASRLSNALLGRDINLGLDRWDALSGSDAVEIAQNIVLQNFDRRIDNHGNDPEVFRLQAIAEVNTGRYEAALNLLERAKGLSSKATYTAHLDYLSGLVATKRHYDLKTSGAYFDRGIERLSGHSNAPGAALEHAWLLNGKALNAALDYRKNGGSEKWETARELAFAAFGLIDEAPGRAYDYLRFNLLANIALLFEMKGEFEVALEIFEQTFGASQSEDLKDESVGAHFCYRVALLKAKLDQCDDADHWLQAAYDKTLEFECPFSQERVTRAELILAEHRRQLTGRAPDQDEILTRGRDLAERNFSADGIEFYDTFGERAAAGPGALFRLVSPKMPAYIPEVDFEDLPKVDLNRQLSSASYAEKRA